MVLKKEWTNNKISIKNDLQNVIKLQNVEN